MTPPFRSSPPAGCGGDRCASGRDAWPLHHVRHDGVFCRLCSSCVMLYHPAAFCSACLHLLPPASDAAVDQEKRADPALAPPGPIVACSSCGLFVAHRSCAQDSASFVCPPCAAAAEGRSFSFTPDGAGRRTMDERDARVLLVAARLAHESVGRAAVAAREEAERCVREAAAARKRSREMLDVAFRLLEADGRKAREAKKPVTAPPPKKKTSKSSEVNRDRDKLLKLNAMQQPALAFAAAAAAAASSMPLSMPPSSREDKKPVKQEAQDH
ncbi:hypothetical protein GUJ93_ZPchr0005g14830 [Zizania palustris]|uniref:Uncharacterized protein n=1 Tax=Zizania palustris TaxID=103762 RepID=A0A8J5SLY2_ZIZPA|nr:hypothetical protein GUJ93_ZPchr0005g14830 [Zizania palustris]